VSEGMKKLNKTELPPDNHVMKKEIGDDVIYLFASDPEYIALSHEREVLKAAMGRVDSKAIRSEAVKRITVTTTAGNVFDGDETSQDRMTRAITAMEGLPVETTTLWVLSDNTPAQVTRDELKEALLLAGQAQSDLWVIE